MSGLSFSGKQKKKGNPANPVAETQGIIRTNCRRGYRVVAHIDGKLLFPIKGGSDGFCQIFENDWFVEKAIKSHLGQCAI